MPRVNCRTAAGFVLSCLAALMLVGCPSNPAAKAPAGGPAGSLGAMSRGSAKIQGVSLNDPLRAVADDHPVTLAAAKNEWASFAIQVTGLPKPPSNKRVAYSFRVKPPTHEGGAAIGAEHVSAAQILPMPVDVNRAGFVRHTGLSATSRPLPRALLPIPTDNGTVNLAAARDPSRPTDPNARATPGSPEPLLFWIDLHVPPETAPGEYASTCELIASDSPAPIASVPVKLTIHDFVLPDERHLVMTSSLGWEDLKRLYPHFEAVRPNLVNRDKPEYAATLTTLDSLVKLAQLHRTEVTVPRLQPTAKWPPAKPPTIDWSDLDTVVTPWLSGEAFADKVPLNHWPLPPVDYLDRFDRKSQQEYWSQAATHFDQKSWLARSPIVLDLAVPGRAGAAQAIQMSADAAQRLAAHAQVRVVVPLEDDQIQLARKDNPNFVDPKSTDRLLAASPGIVYGAITQPWPGEVPRPKHWLRTDVPGLVPYVGAGGDERDVRVWSWLAFLRQAGMIQWGSPLPRTSIATEAADPNDLVWFYPGSWFGVDEPLPTVQLKWLRRAQQDFEYLWLARQRGEVINAALMARLISKPVQIKPGQMPDPAYALLTGTSDAQAWSDGQGLLAKVVLLREPGQPAERDKADALGLEILRWAKPQDQALVMARTTDWGVELGTDRALSLRLGIDVYNASDARTLPNQIQWTPQGPKGLSVSPQPIEIPPLQPYHVDRFVLQASFDLGSIDADDRQPAGVSFIDGYSKDKQDLHFVLPASTCDRAGPNLKIDGKLADWNPADAIQNAPLVRMLNRPALQKQELQYADRPATVYTSYGDENFYVAFKLGGVGSAALTQTRNFVDYQFRRAWGEDLCELLVQPVFADNTVGPVLHLVCKPAGHWVERKRDPRVFSEPWQPFEGTGIRYTATIDPPAGEWAGEIAIPWKAVTDRDRGLPRLLRFNFVQHTNSTGESASWAGPIDFGRDDSFMGVLYVRESTDPGVAGP